MKLTLLAKVKMASQISEAVLDFFRKDPRFDNFPDPYDEDNYFLVSSDFPGCFELSLLGNDLHICVANVYGIPGKGLLINELADKCMELTIAINGGDLGKLQELADTFIGLCQLAKSKEGKRAFTLKSSAFSKANGGNLAKCLELANTLKEWSRRVEIDNNPKPSERWTSIANIQRSILDFFKNHPRYEIFDNGSDNGWYIQRLEYEDGRSRSSLNFIPSAPASFFEIENGILSFKEAVDSEAESFLASTLLDLIEELVKEINAGDLSKLQDISDAYEKYEQIVYEEFHLND